MRSSVIVLGNDSSGDNYCTVALYSLGVTPV